MTYGPPCISYQFCPIPILPHASCLLTPCPACPITIMSEAHYSTYQLCSMPHAHYSLCSSCFMPIMPMPIMLSAHYTSCLLCSMPNVPPSIMFHVGYVSFLLCSNSLGFMHIMPYALSYPYPLCLMPIFSHDNWVIINSKQPLPHGIWIVIIAPCPKTIPHKHCLTTIIPGYMPCNYCSMLKAPDNMEFNLWHTS